MKLNWSLRGPKTSLNNGIILRKTNYPEVFLKKVNMDRTYVCKWCKRRFSTNYNLLKHQRTAKYCLKIQNSKKKEKFVCEWCGKNSEGQQYLDKHTGICSARMTKIVHENEELQREVRRLTIEVEEGQLLKIKISALKIEKNQLKEQVLKMEGEIRGLKTAPPTTTTNVRNTKKTYYVNQKLANLPVKTIRALTVKTIKEDINSGKYTFEIFKKGIQGLVSFIDNIIKIENEDGTIERNYACTDSARNKFYRLVHSRVWELDDGASFLGEILNQLQSQVKKYYYNCLDMKRDTTDKNERRRYQYIIDKTRMLYQGVNSEEGPDREELFNLIRKKIKSIASV